MMEDNNKSVEHGIVVGNLNDDPSNHQQRKTGLNRETWSILFLSSIFFLSYNGRSITGPLLPSLENDLGLTHADSGGLFIFLFLGYLVSLFGAVGVGVALIAVAGSHSLWALRIGLIAVGLGSGLYPPSGIAALTKLAKPAHWGRAIGIHDIAPNLSIVAAPAVAGILVNWASWRSVYFVFGTIAVLVGFAFIRFGPPVTGRGQIPDLATLKSLLSRSSLWIICILFTLGAAGMIGVYNLLPLYLTSIHDLDPSSANMIVALSRVPGIGMALVAGLITDLIGPRKVIAIVFACTGLLNIMIGIESGTTLIVVIFIQAAVATCFFPAGLAAVSKLFPFELRSLAIAISAAFSGCVGSGLISALMGMLADKGMFNMGLILNGIIVLIGLPVLFFLKFERENARVRSKY
ncbi:MAG: MFS transporter [Deltaproteobacteria bacterium]|nr:MFS transporter [Deltaproteobacteria bacterium]